MFERIIFSPYKRLIPGLTHTHALSFAAEESHPRTLSTRIREAVRVDDLRKTEISRIDSAMSEQRLFQVDQKEIRFNWLLADRDQSKHDDFPPPPASESNTVFN